MTQPTDKKDHRGDARKRRPRRPAQKPERVQPTSPRWQGESGVKVCRKCGGRMYPADWI